MNPLEDDQTIDVQKILNQLSDRGQLEWECATLRALRVQDQELIAKLKQALEESSGSGSEA